MLFNNPIFKLYSIFNTIQFNHLSKHPNNNSTMTTTIKTINSSFLLLLVPSLDQQLYLLNSKKYENSSNYKTVGDSIFNICDAKILRHTIHLIYGIWWQSGLRFRVIPLPIQIGLVPKVVFWCRGSEGGIFWEIFGQCRGSEGRLFWN